MVPLGPCERGRCFSSIQTPVKVIVHSILSLNQVSCTLLKVEACVAITGQASLIAAIPTVIHIVTLFVFGDAHFVGAPEVGDCVTLCDRRSHSAICETDVIQCCYSIVVGNGLFEEHVEIGGSSAYSHCDTDHLIP